MKPIPVLQALLSLAFTPAALSAQSEIFHDPGFAGTRQYSEWDLFSYAAGTGNAPDVAGTVGLLTQTTSGAIITSGGNIYSFSNDLRFSLTASSPEPLGRISLQYRLLGQEGAVLSTKLLLNGGTTELGPDTSEEIYRVEFGSAFGESVDLGMAYTWNVGDYDVTAYEIVFETLVHTSLDQVRLDTEARAEIVPVVPPEIVSTAVDDGAIAVTFTTIEGQLYRLMVSADLATWRQVGPAVTGDGAHLSISDPDGMTGGAHFYRVEAK